MSGGHLQRALHLIEQSRHDLAEPELRRQVAGEPNDPLAHALLALCLSRAGKHAEATAEAQAAVGLAPNTAFPHYVLAGVLEDRDRLDEAAAAVQEAIRLDPEDADFHALLAQVRLAQRRRQPALAAAEAALAIDPQHVAANNLRAMALVKLGRRDEAGATIEAALAREPENAVTHANQGWALLHRGEFGRALEHFREALRLDPTQEWARAGLVEALKARYPVYGPLLRYFLWMSTLSRKAQWAVILGGLIGFRALRAAAAANPALGPWVTPLLVLYGLFVFLTWTADPLFALLLRLNRFGRYALSAEETAASSWTGAVLLVVLGAALLFAVTREPALAGGALAGMLVLFLISGTYRCARGWPRRTMAGYTATVAGLAALSLPLSLAAPEDAEAGLVPLTLALVLGVAGTWLAALLAGVRPRR
jgi:tetratricopeptide (TPR) repeat protein